MQAIDYHGIIPAIAVPFNKDFSINEPDLRRFAQWLGKQEGVKALMTNGHTGEVFSLTARERAEVTRITADAVKDICPVISSIVCEGINEAVEQAGWAKEAGAAGLDVMPPHHWLRFGFKPEHCLDYFHAIAEASKLPLIVHIYPAWTRGSYSSQLLADLARLPYVKAFKMGEREMNKYARDIKEIRAADPTKALLTCHDEYLLSSMVQGIDGALVGFASLVPGLINDLLKAVRAGDLHEAMRVQALITPLKDAVYGAGEPTGEAHGRMKAAMALAGIISDGTVRPPTHAPSEEELTLIRAALQHAGMLKQNAA
ncbi:dihydrodipicolinate synthase family protein [Herbaspirillum sp. RTI4]|uniref:dihydrodipicolinate synthase family protein n=1 Tax=Herbaspirillum sp. RTI4 TaxID=3048640 RepID=UPI002AB43183|nr:dihydrodipicolinate synthase family protein [Herbaspirillum sp. RTI4]MDY7579149.1 dihydrodipicolinate synthase family protein [Herbaspirillum sp. RTI4]MEA9981272.1 dihydrodipicolinate synthase family protein [Herbaspirillum sp. RTI4]